MSERRSLADDREHVASCHERWLRRLNRDMTSPEYRDEWYGEQCLFCRYYVPLRGAFTDDYGACTNPASPFDGTVRFEHDGCDHYSPADDHWCSAPTPEGE